MRIPEHTLVEIQRRVDMHALVSRYVELRKSGREWVGLCPFHSERTPSFYVNAEKGVFRCYGCEAGGSAFSFLQRYLGKTFLETVQDLAREVGVDIEAAEDPQARERTQLREVTEYAARFYASILWDAERGREGRDYLQARGVAAEVARRFGLGWAPPGWTELADQLTREGLLEWGVKAGLVLPRKQGEGYFDFFRHRLMIPIRAQDGRALAFGARIMGPEDGPKYLNSRESALYRKSEVLYGLDQSRDEVRRQKQAVLVEGYFDCMGLHQEGVGNVLALCSTALTSGHLSLLQRGGAQGVTLLLDGDAAGQRAVERLSGALLAAGMATRVAVLPEGQDPDEYARQVGKDGMQRLLSSARPLTEHLFATLLPKGPDSTFEDKMQALERLKPVAAQLAVGLTRSAFIGAVAKAFSLPATELEVVLQGRPPPQPKPAPSATAGAPKPPPSRPPDPMEALFAACLIREPGLASLDPDRLRDNLDHLGLRLLLAQVAAGEDADEVLAQAELPLRRAMSSAVQGLPQGELGSYFRELIHRMKLTRVESQLRQLAQAARSMEGAMELDEGMRAILSRQSELVALRNRLKAEGPAGTKNSTSPV